MREQTEKGWWGRNWGWFVPTACLGCLILPVACVGGCIWLGVSSIKSFDPFEEALAAANSHPRVEELLGNPVVMDWKGLSGQVNTELDNRRAEMNLPLKGPQGRGTLRLLAYQRNGVWEYERLELEVRDHDETIDLREHVARIRSGG